MKRQWLKAVDGCAPWAERVRAFLTVMLSVTIVLCALWAFVSYVQHVVARERLVALAEVDANSTRAQLQEILSGYSALVVTASQNQQFSLLGIGGAGARRAVEDMFVVLASESPDIMQVRLIGPGGIEQIRVDRDGEMVDVRPLHALQDKSERDYFLAARQLPRRGVYLSAIELNVERKVIQTPWRPTLRIATPVGSAGEIFVVNFDARHLLDLFRDEGSHRIPIALADDDGYWLAGAPHEQLWGRQRGFESGVAHEHPDLWQVMAGEQNGTLEHDGTVYVFRHVQADEAVGQRIARPHSVVGATGWYVIAKVTPELVGTVAPWLHPAVLGAGTLIAAMASWLWSGAIVGRRRALAAEAESQSKLMRAERTAGLTSMVAGVAHELNTPIGNAVMVVSTIAEQVDAFERQAASGELRRSTMDRFIKDLREGIAVMLRGLGEAARLIGDFKEIAVDQVSEMRRDFELDAYMQEIARTMSTRFRRAGVALELDLASGVHMHSYPGALGQVVMNLASNTLDHGFADATAGRVVLSTRVQDAEHVTIVVEDNGSGIAPEILTRVFDPFFTTRLGKGGSGLGLSIVRNIVTQILGGTVEVTSEPGRQTRFEIRLPREAPESTGDEKGEVP